MSNKRSVKYIVPTIIYCISTLLFASIYPVEIFSYSGIKFLEMIMADYSFYVMFAIFILIIVSTVLALKTFKNALLLAPVLGGVIISNSFAFMSYESIEAMNKVHYIVSGICYALYLVGIVCAVVLCVKAVKNPEKYETKASAKYILSTALYIILNAYIAMFVAVTLFEALVGWSNVNKVIRELFILGEYNGFNFYFALIFIIAAAVWLGKIFAGTLKGAKKTGFILLIVLTPVACVITTLANIHGTMALIMHTVSILLFAAMVVFLSMTCSKAVKRQNG